MTAQNKLIFVIVIFLIILGFVLYGATDNKNTDKIKIGIISPSTGVVGFLGKNVLQSAQLAIDDLNLNNDVQLVVEDAGNVGGSSDAINAYNKLVKIDGVKLIIDGMSSDSTMSIAPLLEKDKVVMITPLTGGANIDFASEYLFRNGPSDILAGTKPAEEIYNQFGYDSVVLFTDNVEYTLDISKFFKQRYKGNIVLDETINPDAKEYGTELAKLDDLNFDAIIINTSTGISAAILLKELKEHNNKKPIFTNFIAFSQSTLDIAGKDSFEGVYIYMPEFDRDSNMTKLFFEKYQERFGSAPEIDFHSTGTYDAVKLFVEAVDHVGYDGDDVKNYLINEVNDWHGLNGVISFDENGNTQTGFVLKKIINGEVVNLN